MKYNNSSDKLVIYFRITKHICSSNVENFCEIASHIRSFLDRILCRQRISTKSKFTLVKSSKCPLNMCRYRHGFKSDTLTIGTYFLLTNSQNECVRVC